MAPIYRIGTSGWSYQHWRGDFYPRELSASSWFEHYAQRFDTVEVNASFYRLPSAKTVENWGRRAPNGFSFTFKASRYITHIQRMRDCADSLLSFIDRVSLVGSGRLGAILYQVPPGLHRDLDLLESFLPLLPSGLQHVIEFRHRSWFDEEVIGLLGRYDTGFCVHDLRGIECPVVVTGRAGYFRFHGPTEQAYTGNYTDEQLAGWAERIRSAGADAEAVYAYFNNDIGGHAIRNALTLRGMLAA